MNKIAVVVVGLCIEGHRVLTQRRLNEGRFPNLWEFPGGKLEDGETMKQALVREWKEELDLDIDVGHFITECVISFEKTGNVLLPLFSVKRVGPSLGRQIDDTTGREGQLVRTVTFEELCELPGVPTMERYRPFVKDELAREALFTNGPVVKIKASNFEALRAIEMLLITRRVPGRKRAVVVNAQRLTIATDDPVEHISDEIELLGGVIMDDPVVGEPDRAP